MDLIEILKAIIIGIVEGITEWLPVSSTGHMILVDEFLQLDVTEEFKKMFDVVIQFGAILAVVVLYFPKLWPFCKTSDPARFSASGIGAVVKKETFLMWVKVLIACVPAAIVGLAFDDKIDELFYNPWTVAIALIVFGVAFIIVERWNKGRTPKMDGIPALPRVV